MKKVLLIDDDSAFVDTMQRLFDRKPYEYHTAYNCQRGLLLTKEIKPDLIIVDINLPDTDGFNFCKKLKSSKDSKDIPIIIISGTRYDSSMVTDLGISEESYFNKPLDYDEFFNRIKNIFQPEDTSAEGTVE
ncbi:MAG: response regulator [Elusimicrobiota bacterium]